MMDLYTRYAMERFARVNQFLGVLSIVKHIICNLHLNIFFSFAFSNKWIVSDKVLLNCSTLLKYKIHARSLNSEGSAKVQMFCINQNKQLTWPIERVYASHVEFLPTT